MPSPRVVLNVGGEIYETYIDTLERFPTTLLGDYVKRRLHYCVASQQYFFNRSRLFFDAILFFYQSNGMLRCPGDVPLDLFIEECHYFEIPEDVINKLRPPEQISKDKDSASDYLRSGRKTLRQRVWDIVENPETSIVAKIYSMFSLFMILLAVMSLCVESVPSLKVQTERFEENPWAISELVLNSWFLLELLVAMTCTPDIRGFLKSTLTWVDIVAVVPYFIIFSISREKLQSLGFLRIIRLARITRMFRLSKHSERLKLVGQILLSCMGDFKTILMCVAILVTLTGSLVTYLEDQGDNGSGFISIPQGIYWATITLTTCGYGDIYPFSTPGKVFAGGYMLFGAVTLTIPLLSIVLKFEQSYKTMLRNGKGTESDGPEESIEELKLDGQKKKSIYFPRRRSFIPQGSKSRHSSYYLPPPTASRNASYYLPSPRSKPTSRHNSVHIPPPTRSLPVSRCTSIHFPPTSTYGDICTKFDT